MTRLTQAAGRGQWRSRPLCGHYTSAVFAEHPLAPEAADNAPVSVLTWVLGNLDDDQFDVLGPWIHCHTQEPDWRAITADLDARSVERIDVVVSQPGGISRYARARFSRCSERGPTVLELPVEAINAKSPFHGLGARQRRHLPIGSGQFANIRNRVNRALHSRIAHRGKDTALSVAGGVLLRADRAVTLQELHDREGVGRPALDTWRPALAEAGN